MHEKAINAYGFSGFGYIIIDPDTGVGGYLIEGKVSGAFAHGVRVGIFLLIDILLYIISGATASAVAAYIALILAGDIVHSLDVMQPGEVRQCYLRGIAFGFAWSATALEILTSGWAAGILIAFIGAIFSELVEVPTAPKCYFGVSMTSV